MGISLNDHEDRITALENKGGNSSSFIEDRRRRWDTLFDEFSNITPGYASNYKVGKSSDNYDLLIICYTSYVNSDQVVFSKAVSRFQFNIGCNIYLQGGLVICLDSVLHFTVKQVGSGTSKWLRIYGLRLTEAEA